MPSKMLVKTLELLKATDIPLERIAVDTGLKHSFLTRLRYTPACSVPSVDKVETLYEYLTGKVLEF